MNGKYYPNPTFPAAGNYEEESPAPVRQIESPNNFEASRAFLESNETNYIENILKLNKGKKVSVYTSFAHANEWKDKKFDGVIEEANKDHIIISNTISGEWYLIPMVYLNYICFDEKINY